MTALVAVFPVPGRSLYRAYTRWYNPAWPGCCLHTVEVCTRREAKRAAIAAHKRGECTSGARERGKING